MPSPQSIIRIPRTFFDDHQGRMLPTPEVVKETSRNVWVVAEGPGWNDLIADAEFYAGPWGPDDAGWVVAAAKALLKCRGRE